MHVHLNCPYRDSISRILIWQKFRERFSKDLKGPSDLDLEGLIAWDLNGRQIRNLIKNTQTWCLAKKESITIDRVVVGIELAAPRAQRQEQT